MSIKLNPVVILFYQSYIEYNVRIKLYKLEAFIKIRISSHPTATLTAPPNVLGSQGIYQSFKNADLSLSSKTRVLNFAR